MFPGLFLRSLVASVVLLGTWAAAENKNALGVPTVPGINYRFAKSTHPPTPDEVTDNYQTIRPLNLPGANSKSAAAVLGAHQRRVGGIGYQNITSTSVYGTQYGIELQVRDTPLTVLLDTGSSDTWVIKGKYRCLDYSGLQVEQANCAFGPGYTSDFQYGSVPQQHLYIQYGDGETVYGPLGYTDITVGNITVAKQQVGFADTAYWTGNNQTSGLIGLAYPSITNAYVGNATEHGWRHQVPYSPLFTTMVGDGLIQPSFSIAINRNSSDGMIGWGGIPPALGVEPSFSASLDIVIVRYIELSIGTRY